jgi:hypothetical protein
MKPTHTGALGDTVFDGDTTWVCIGVGEWVDRIPPVFPAIDPIIRPMRPAARMNQSSWSWVWRDLLWLAYTVGVWAAGWYSYPYFGGHLW